MILHQLKLILILMKMVKMFSLAIESEIQLNMILN